MRVTSLHQRPTGLPAPGWAPGLALLLLVGACSAPAVEPSPLPIDGPAPAAVSPTEGFVEAPYGLVSAPVGADGQEGGEGVQADIGQDE